MASGGNYKEFGEKKPQYDRNRIFSSTTTDHYKNKLAQIGIQKDLREIIERKKLQKEQDQSAVNIYQQVSHESNSVSPGKVRFEVDKKYLSRSKSFSSGRSNSLENHSSVHGNKHLNKSNPKSPQNVYKNEQKLDSIDLLCPTNIKVELKTDSGDRKCFLDTSQTISKVKCDLRNSRNVLKHVEEKVSVSNDSEHDKSDMRFTERGRGRNYRQMRGKPFLHTKETDRESSLSVEDSFSKLSIGVHPN